MSEEVMKMMADYEAGKVSEEEYLNFIDGDPTEAAEKPGDTDSGDSPNSTETVEAKEDPKEDPEKEPKKEPKEEEPVVLAKDGKNTIPFSVVEDLRETVKATKEQNEQLTLMLKEQKGFMEEFKAAQEQNEEAGDTEATDNLFEELEEDYPGITDTLNKMVAPLQEKIDSLEAEREQLKQQEEALTAEQEAQKEFDSAVTELNKDYPDIIKSDEFWKWFDKAPAYVQAVKEHGNPQAVADVISLYQSENAQPSSDKPETKEKVKEAIKKAEEKPAVNSLSDIPGATTTPESDEMSALANMDPLAMADKFAGKSLAEVERLMSRML